MKKKVGAGLEIFCFGAFRLRFAGNPLELPGRKARELVALLACEQGKPVSKRRAASLLWDVGPEQARDSLSKVCRAIRSFSKGHGDCIPLGSSYGELWLDLSHVRCDLTEFQELSRQEGEESWRQAAALYGGELLLADCFEWSEYYAGKYEMAYLELCRRLAGYYREQGLRRLAERYERELL